MSTVKLFLVTVLMTFLPCLAEGRNQSFVVTYAIQAMIDNHFANYTAKQPGNINVVNIGEETEEFLKFLKVKKSNTKIAVFTKIADGDKIFNLIKPSVLFFDTVSRFKENAKRIGWAANRKQRQQILVHVPGLKKLDILETFPDGFKIDQVSFLMNETKTSIDLVTGYMFTQHACKELQLRTINRFDTMTWKNSSFYPNKYRNFYKCKLNIAGTVMADEENGELVEVIFTKVLNAELVDYPEKTIQDCAECDLSRQNFYVSGSNTQFILSYPHAYEIHTFAVPPGEPYTDLERMFMMFSFELWIAIVVTFSIAFVTTLSLNFASGKVRNFIAGRDVCNPTMNLISVFLTGGQVKTPGRNFARFLLILFIIWSLIIRTCHQSMLFDLLQADLRRPSIRTLDELFESDLTLHDTVGKEKFSITVDEYFKERMAMPSTRFTHHFS